MWLIVPLETFSKLSEILRLLHNVVLRTVVFFFSHAFRIFEPFEKKGIDTTEKCLAQFV